MSEKQFNWLAPILLDWFSRNDRPLPWKGEKDVYLIWLSEIILQQTRVEQGLPYYKKFREAFPTVTDLAKAKEDKVMKLWEGLGYYSRARNLHYTAQKVAFEMGGEFPDTYQGLLRLKGVGPYTAAAIASFAYGLPCAVVDGNVYRVLSRIFGIATPVDTTAGKKEFQQLANQVLDQTQPGKFNQAMMDFGATQCTPVAPDCTTCPFQHRCHAFATDRISDFPVKSKKIKPRKRIFNYLVFEYQDAVWLQQRIQKDIWQKLYEFPLIESALPLDKNALVNHVEFPQQAVKGNYVVRVASKPLQQQLTHQRIIGYFWKIELENPLLDNTSSFFQVSRKNINNFAFPKIIDWYLKDKTLYLDLFS